MNRIQITDTTIHEVEEIFGFALYDWQKNYLLGKTNYRSSARCNGNTFIYCVRLLLSDGYDISKKNIYKFEDEYHGTQYYRWFTRYIIEIDNELKRNGFKTRLVDD